MPSPTWQATTLTAPFPRVWRYVGSRHAPRGRKRPPSGWYSAKGRRSMAEADTQAAAPGSRWATAACATLTEDLAVPLSPEDQTVQSMPDVSPTKWHLAHTTWFFETFLLGPSGRLQPFHPAFGYLFNSYYEAVGARHPAAERGLISRPGRRPRSSSTAPTSTGRWPTCSTPACAAADDLVELGLHHEQQHQELLLMDIKHVLSCNPLRPAYAPPRRRAAVRAPVAARVDRARGGLVEVGHDGAGFGSTTNSPGTRRCVPRSPWPTGWPPAGNGSPSSTTAGTTDPSCGSPTAGRRSRPAVGGAPLLVHARHGRRVVALHARRPALARPLRAGVPRQLLRGRRLRPLVGGAPAHRVRVGGGGGRTPDRQATSWTGPASTPPPPTAGTGLCGDVWQWTASAYSPYPGFRPAAGAVGEYNGKFMVNQYVLRGGSCATPPGHLRATYRNFFPAGARWAFSGVRLARDL